MIRPRENFCIDNTGEEFITFPCSKYHSEDSSKCERCKRYFDF